MPFKSEAQRRFIFAAAARGEEWARKFLRDMGIEPPGRQGAGMKGKRGKRRGRLSDRARARVRELEARRKAAEPGSGERFRALSEELRLRGVRNPDAAAAAIGRRKYGKAFGKMAARGRAR